MTEEIIIDGINVAGCCYYESKNDTGRWCDSTCTRDRAPVFRCDKMPNCHYKQRKRLEQENEQLKEENERLKKDFSSYEDDIEDWVSDNSILYQYDDRTPDTLEELQACMESTHEQWQKYKQALEEIKSICQDENNTCTGECGNFNVAQRVLDVLCNLEG